MRKIDKNCDLSTEYKAWEEALEEENSNHPVYNSSKGKYYFDIVMQLYRCQNGLCAYTERKLCAPDHYETSLWRDGKYVSPKPYMEGQLDHFDPELKTDKAWLWGNFFMVHSDINTKVKRSKKVDPILKPDREEYDPFELLEYDFTTHTFFPKVEEGHPDFMKIYNMVVVLGLNHISIFRKSYFEEKLKEIYKGDRTWKDILANEYVTSFEMVKNKIINGEISLQDYFEKDEIEKEGLVFKNF